MRWLILEDGSRVIEDKKSKDKPKKNGKPKGEPKGNGKGNSAKDEPVQNGK
jgi:hypothetical protein